MHSPAQPTSVLPEQWRLLRTVAAEGAWNMACDVTLMNVARSDNLGILRVYGWNRPTVSFGRHERTAGIYSAESLTAAGLDAVRRPTGGRALLHHREVTYSVTMPIRDSVPWQRAYDGINQLLLAALLELGIPGRIAGDGPDSVPVFNASVPGDAPAVVSALEPDTGRGPSQSDGTVCFSGIAPGEIVVEDNKLVASSVWRERGAYLQHGSILLADDQHRLSAMLGPNVAKAAPAAVLSHWLNPMPTLDVAASRMEAALHSAFRHSGNASSWSIPEDVIPVIESTAERLMQSQWLWRR